jgi:hypothetical protein
VGGIVFDVEGKIGVGIVWKCVLSNLSFDRFKSVVLFRAPVSFEFVTFNLDKFDQGYHDVSTMTPYGTIKC